MPRVFIPQIPSRFDRGINSWVPTVSVDAAKEFGEIVVMLPPEASRLDANSIVTLLKTAMTNFGEDDYILALGNPMAIAIVAALADRASSPLRLLQWDKQTRRYQLIEATIDDEGGRDGQ